MIQFNLLPDVKIEYIKAQRQKQLIMSISFIASVAAVTLFVLLLLFVNVAQKKSMNDLTKDIKTTAKDLIDTKDLDKILTVQNQLGALDQLHGDKVVSSRLADYMQQVTPAQVTISELDVDFGENTMSITGNAESLIAINTYADSLKFTKFTTKNNTNKTSAFTEVVLSSFSRADSRNAYTITLSFNPVIFSQDEDVEFTVPQMTTTRSNTETPSALFEQPAGGR